MNVKKLPLILINLGFFRLFAQKTKRTIAGKRATAEKRNIIGNPHFLGTQYFVTEVN